MLFTRDLRVEDNPALAEAARSDRVLALFVADPWILERSARNRIAFLAEALADLDGELRALGGGLVVRRGETVAEVLRAAHEVGAERVHVTEDVGAFAEQRARRLKKEAARTGIEVVGHPGVTVVPPGSLMPSGGGDHYKVFTPYWKAWEAADRRGEAHAPPSLRPPDGAGADRTPYPDPAKEGLGLLSPGRLHCGADSAARLRTWLDDGIRGYGEHRDDLAADATSHLSTDLRFGRVSPLVLERAAGRRGEAGAAFVRQLAWRDFHHQVLNAFPALPRADYRPRTVEWRDDEEAFAAWTEGRTGVPIVDAGMRQLLQEGFMHNRARLITAGYLTRILRVHWKRGAGHFHALLSDGDLADNYGNWQWVAGTGNDTRPNRGFNPVRQALRYDPRGEYVRRYVPELAHVPGSAVHEPWKHPGVVYHPPLEAPD